jgi:hypothetical protein
MRTYAGHRRHRSSVPRSDVLVEQRRGGKRLRAEPHALTELTYCTPEPRRSVTLGAQCVQSAECVRSDVQALDHRDAGQLQQLNRRGSSMMLLLIYKPQRRVTRKSMHACPQALSGLGAWPRGMAKQHRIPSQASPLEGRCSSTEACRTAHASHTVPASSSTARACAKAA